jgi:hypothetical protein
MNPKVLRKNVVVSPCIISGYDATELPETNRLAASASLDPRLAHSISG